VAVVTIAVMDNGNEWRCCSGQLLQFLSLLCDHGGYVHNGRSVRAIERDVASRQG
jgi:hypothetical protein